MSQAVNEDVSEEFNKLFKHAQNLKNEIDEFIKLLSGKKVLDVACGPGHDVSYLNKKGLDCIGIDLSKEMIKLAKKNIIGKFKFMDIFNLEFNNKSFN